MWPPQLPQTPDGRVLVHIGCGNQNSPGWTNVDTIPLPHIHFVSRAERLPMFPSNTADLIYACHILEHISYLKYHGVLSEWYRVLKPGGTLRISLPDFDKLIAIYKSGKGDNLELTMPPLMGGQDYEYNFHCGIFNERYLTDLFLAAGFKKVRRWDPNTAPDYPFNDWAKKLAHGKYPISLNLEAIK
ncbi:MAG: hypothetical protein A3D52_01615 [Candidatus Taylorbacteria bacterium RIFCSPHIGHO2_02_FULL_44_36]|uniref:Methyltransferase type 11 domain-containing protein n=1 Tax=Candidatus Taylorbacteria bacterium RIFCSPLOWO2_12_FULL_44_15c TaxID=1802333 RepID=A0A1G2P9K8_9BACT|nr:MAG: hypothetical protein A3D52_01615 [Candidatus Taylorbacteria bacterium RIFCSPHIGHO2_02_FULL_44_36]OHA38176.1 MAG: hypothetical protein A3I97_01760 [Candidatus Taylorbacteria bacterium RIFCSPLOWO2_02_FULL_44_35]OHA44332.1 MAG: hypothetical protein A3G03_01620 [Candidatus Taylorbacteria bacterium RIFCSPLOWO2_12_FULL_44_15c]